MEKRAIIIETGEEVTILERTGNVVKILIDGYKEHSFYHIKELRIL